MGKRKMKEDERKKKIPRREEQEHDLERWYPSRPSNPSPALTSPASPGATEVEQISNTAEEEQLPEEYLLALGKEGEVSEEVGDPIRNELALRWAKIMCDGMGKDARDNITKKYHIPSNFTQAVAPSMNPEILASLSDISLKRDKRIVHRQNLTGKLMTCLGRSLTNILKGNINTKNLIEEINDAAKLAAEIFYQDSSSRKFFALSGTNKTVQDAVKNLKTDEFLFGTDCADKIKTAQTIQKTGSQIKIDSSATKKTFKPVNSAKKQLNWKGPSQNLQPQHQQARGGHQQYQHRPAYRTQFLPRQKDRKRPPVRSRPRYHR